MKELTRKKEEITNTILSVRMTKEGNNLKFELLRAPMTIQEEYYLKIFLKKNLFNENKIIDIE